MEIREQLKAGSIYHICTKSVGQESIFRDARDYFYFKRKMNERLTAAWEILAFTLIPNEIHFIVRIAKEKIEGEHINHSMLLSHLLNGYVQHYNYKYGRSGSLLSRSFRRKSLPTETEIQEAICKVHNLPLAQKLVSKSAEWIHSSFRRFSSSKFSGRKFAVLIALFKDCLNFERLHEATALIVDNILPKRTWVKVLSQQEIAFREKHPLGVHRWSRRYWENTT